MNIELGISTFGETTVLEKTGKALSHEERLKNILEEIELADQVGLDIYAIGEHHREDFAVSAPEILLAAAASKTKNIKLSSAVTILSSIDPVRVYQQYATIDALSSGRAEIMVGRGSFTESFSLFGYDLTHYDELFKEKLDMLLETKNNTYLHWKGRHTQRVDGKPVYPRAVQKDFPISVATGGNPRSTERIAEMGLPIVYAIIGGNPLAFRPLIQRYRNIAKERGYDPQKMTVTAHSWGWLSDDKEKAQKEYFFPTKQRVDAISKDRAHWHTLSYEDYLHSISDHGAMFVGDADTVAKKIIHVVENLGLDRFMLHLPVGSMPHEDTLKAIRIFGEEVAPKVKAYFKDKKK